MCSCCKDKSAKCRLMSVGIVGGCLVVVGGVLMLIYWAVFYSEVKKQTTIMPGTIFYKEWAETTQSLYLYFYLLNVTNRDEFLAQKPGSFVKPVVEEAGPYTYSVKTVKDNIEFVDVTPEEVAYRQQMHFTFLPELSGGTEDDLITTVNFIALAMPPVLDYLLSLPGANNVTNVQKRALYRAVDNVINDTRSDLLFTHTSGGLLFGFQDPLLTAVSDLLNNLLDQLGLSHLGPVWDTFGLFMLMNMTEGWKNYHAYTGNPEYWLTNVVSRLENETSLDYWYGDSCNMINGTDETTRPPLKPKDEEIYFFVPSFCRSTYAVFNREVVINGITGWEYVVPPEVFKAPAHSEYNKCFCEVGSSEEFCVHDGGVLLRPCLFGAPILLSAPHFLHGDGYYRDRVVGMSPDASKHTTAFTYEPNSGACLRGHKLAQFNFYMKPNENFEISQRINEVFAFPIFWAHGTYTVDEKYSNLLYGLLVISYAVVLSFQIIFCIVGGFLCIFVAYFAFRRRYGGAYQPWFEAQEDDDMPKKGVERADMKAGKYISSNNVSFENNVYSDVTVPENQDDKDMESIDI